MKGLPAAVLCALLALSAQPKRPAKPAASSASDASSREQADLEKALDEAGGNPVEYLRAIEKHLEKYPDSPRRPELERAAVRAAMEADDDARIILYGERVLARDSGDPEILDRVCRALLAAGSQDDAARALQYARRYETILQDARSHGPHSGTSPAAWQNQLDREAGAALLYQARASGILEHDGAALALAERSFAIWPDAASARERARWLERLGRPDDAIAALADAFTIPDPRASEAARERDRGHMGELYVMRHGSEAGLGDLVLDAYDRNVALLHARALRLRAADPNAGLTDPMQFTLGGVDGSKLDMASLKGKVLVLDFWTTWCGPCRAEHPLLELVKQRFRDNPNVVFLSLDADDDRSLVKPFLSEAGWKDRVCFEDGLARALEVNSFPTTIVIGRSGKLSSRLNGYVPERFVEMLAERITEAVKE
jgi:thiol-disulfide isomerase/thioredoxin